MTLTTHRPARSVSSLVADDPVELAADLPRLPHGITLDLGVLRDAACGEHDLELFYPEPDDTAAEHAAKQVCATCPVREPCLDMALTTGDQHAILGGTTPAERIPLRRQRQVAHTRHRDRPGRGAGAGGAKHGCSPAGRCQRYRAGLGAVQDRRDRPCRRAD